MEIKLYADDVRVLAKALISRHVKDYFGSSQRLKKEAEEWLFGKGEYLISFSDCCRALGWRKEFIVSRLKNFSENHNVIKDIKNKIWEGQDD